MDMPNLDGMPTYPAEWDEESTDVAFSSDITAGYYARGMAAQSISEKRMFADIIIDRLTEIKRRGWSDRVDRYLEYSGSMFGVRLMDAWAKRARNDYVEWLEQKKNALGGSRAGGHRRFAGGDEA